MVVSVTEWCRRIIEYFLAHSVSNLTRVPSKEFVLNQFGNNIDENSPIAWDRLVRDNILIYRDTYFTLNLPEKKLQVDAYFEDVVGEEVYISQPLESEAEGLILQYVTESESAHNASTYYLYTSINDPTYWIALIKAKHVGKAERVVLGSFNDRGSRISKIWEAAMQAASRSHNATFIKKRVEEIEPQASGNNRQPLKAVFDIFKSTELVEVVGYNGNSEIYRLTGKKPRIINLDKYIYAD